MGVRPALGVECSGGVIIACLLLLLQFFSLRHKKEAEMKAKSISTGGSNLVVIVLGIMAAFLVFAVLTGRTIPLIMSDRAALLALLVIGMIMCTQGGISRVAASGAWFHPFTIIGYLLGAGIIVIGIAALLGKNIPPLTNYYQSFVVVAVIAAVKVVLTTIHRLFL